MGIKAGSPTFLLKSIGLLQDGTLSNTQPIQGAGSADGSSTAEDAMRGITENRITMILEKLKTGSIRKAG